MFSELSRETYSAMAEASGLDPDAARVRGDLYRAVQQMRRTMSRLRELSCAEEPAFSLRLPEPAPPASRQRDVPEGPG